MILLGADWPKFLLRESAFYPHERAVTGEGEWHHFAVSYDPAKQRIVGWRDGELISTVDLSTAGMEPLRREGLKSIVTGKGFSGLLDEVRIYNRPLDEVEVRAIHAEERSSFAGRNDAVATSRALRVYSFAEEDRTLYRAWLQHRPIARPKSPELLKRIVAAGDHPTVANAARELAAALREMVAPTEIVSEAEAGPRIVLGTPATSPWIRAHAPALALEEIRHEGYVLKTIQNKGSPVAVYKPFMSL